MFFGIHGGCGPSLKWQSDPSPTPSPSTSVLDFGSSEGGWSDQSDCADSVVTQASAELTNVDRTGSVNGGRVPRRRPTNPSGGVQPRTNGTNKKKKRFQCSLCDETFSRRHDMMRHEVSFLIFSQTLSFIFLPYTVKSTWQKARLDLRDVSTIFFQRSHAHHTQLSCFALVMAPSLTIRPFLRTG